MSEKRKETGALQARDLCAAVGVQVMDSLNEPGATIAVKGSTLDDGTYEFVLGPVFLPRGGVSLTAPASAQLLVNLRPDGQYREPVKQVRWMCKRGDGHAELPQPDRAIVVDEVTMPPNENTICVFYHLSS